ncbi:MAG: HAMP domain-containing histidine kinase [Phycisphaerales bacterium]|nr:HAMP domain-containing histidine kinase [Phycisphaerales bacterium]
MPTRGLFYISLARKCQLMFGLAVALIITAALLVPAYYIETLVHQKNYQRAYQLATLAQPWADSSITDWKTQQAALNRWWEDNAKNLKLPEAKPRLIRLQKTEASKPPTSLWQNISAEFLSHMEWPFKVNLLGSLWQLIPSAARTNLIAQGRRLGHEFIRTLGPRPLRLDDFQKECVERMRRDESINEIPHTDKKAGHYRYIMAVRRLDPVSGRRPLVGMVDIQLTPETDKELLSDDALIGARIVIVLAGVLAGFLAIVVFYLILHKFILAPVRDLKDLVEQIAGGQFSARADLTTGDEFEELSDAFNDMLGQLERARVELETINRSLDTRLGELAETNVALYESNRLKSEFLANVSHELRTPLTSIIGFADLLRDIAQSGPITDQSRIIRFTGNILTSGRMLLDIINDLLDLAKIEAGKVELHRTTFSLRDVCEALHDFMRPLMEKKQLAMNMDIDEELPLMHSDAGKIRQVLFNLLSNAVKYTPESGTVHLQARASNARQVQLIVEDTGPGIAPENQQIIFEKFHQLDASMTREHSGTGLGLPISRELCTMLGGTIRLESELGRGTRFLVDLPVECPETVQRTLPSLT